MILMPVVVAELMLDMVSKLLAQSSMSSWLSCVFSGVYYMYHRSSIFERMSAMVKMGTWLSAWHNTAFQNTYTLAHIILVSTALPHGDFPGFLMRLWHAHTGVWVHVGTYWLAPSLCVSCLPMQLAGSLMSWLSWKALLYMLCAHYYTS